LTKVKPHTVVAQIHGGKLDDIVVWRVEGAKLWLTDGNNLNKFLVDEDLRLLKRFRLKYELVDGVCHFYYDGAKLSYTKRAADPECYFKAGLYLQSNKKTAPRESTSEYSEVVVYSAKVTHAHV
jgi:hypothetical protein